MKKIILLIALLSQPALSAEQFSASQLISSCYNGKDTICKTITSTKSAIEKSIKTTVPSYLLSPTLLAFKLISDKGIRIKNPLSKNDNLLIQQNQITYGINISF